MQLSSFSDFTLRILIYLAMEKDRSISTREIAERFDLSFDHLAKAAQFLSREGYVTASRGRGGGIRLARDPAQISVGEILRRTEAATGVVECLRSDPLRPPQCKLAGVCGLTSIFADANEAFFSALDKRTLADSLPDPAIFKLRLGIFPRLHASPFDASA